VLLAIFLLSLGSSLLFELSEVCYVLADDFKEEGDRE